VEEIARRVRELAPGYNVFLGAAVRTRQSGRADAVERCPSLWCDLDGRDALERLRDFRPLPSIVLRTGSADHGLGIWPLRVSLSPHWTQRANRRLARALGGDMAATDPARILRPAGSLNHKHVPPREVRCTRLELDVFTFEQVVGELPDTDHYTPRVRSVEKRPTSDDAPRVLAGLARTVAEAPQGNRNNALYWAARRVRDHVDCGELDVCEASAELRSAAECAGLPEFEIARTISSAMTAEARAA
jgi:hypothetical protein